MNKISIIGLGYVGLPLAVEFSKKYEVVGFDTNIKRVKELKKGIDITNECSKKEIYNLKTLKFSSDISEISDSNFHIITVPTPIDKAKRPDLRPLISATETIGTVLKPKDIIIYESTVFPGTTEDICVPILEEEVVLDLIKIFVAIALKGKSW